MTPIPICRQCQLGSKLNGSEWACLPVGHFFNGLPLAFALQRQTGYPQKKTHSYIVLQVGRLAKPPTVQQAGPRGERCGLPRARNCRRPGKLGGRPGECPEIPNDSFRFPTTVHEGWAHQMVQATQKTAARMVRAGKDRYRGGIPEGKRSSRVLHEEQVPCCELQFA